MPCIKHYIDGCQGGASDPVAELTCLQKGRAAASVGQALSVCAATLIALLQT